VNLALGVLCMWIGSALLYIATHNTGAASPWQAYQKILTGIGGESL
jgi:hypothetical protein